MLRQLAHSDAAPVSSLLVSWLRASWPSCISSSTSLAETCVNHGQLSSLAFSSRSSGFCDVIDAKQKRSHPMDLLAVHSFCTEAQSQIQPSDDPLAKVDGNKISTALQQALQVLGVDSNRMNRTRQVPSQEESAQTGTNRFQLAVPAISWIPHSSSGAPASEAPVQVLPETTIFTEAESVKDAHAALTRRALSMWMDHGIVQHHKGNLQLAVKAVPVAIPGGGTFDSYIDKAGLKSMRTKAWAGPSYVISTPAEAADAVSDILHRCSTASTADTGQPPEQQQHRPGLSEAESATVLGFDLEYQPVWSAGAPQSPPALVQIATPGAVYMFHLRAFMAGKTFRGSKAAVAEALQVLSPLLEADGLYKCGVGVSGDIELLRQFAPRIKYRGFVDMELVARSAKFKRCSLQALSCLLLHHSLDKREQCSNWGAAQLNPKQIRYAATDAWASREISLRLAPLWFPRGGAPLGSQWLAAPKPPKVPKPEATEAANRGSPAKRTRADDAEPSGYQRNGQLRHPGHPGARPPHSAGYIPASQPAPAARHGPQRAAHMHTAASAAQHAPSSMHAPQWPPPHVPPPMQHLPATLPSAALSAHALQQPGARPHPPYAQPVPHSASAPHTGLHVGHPPAGLPPTPPQIPPPQPASATAWSSTAWAQRAPPPDRRSAQPAVAHDDDLYAIVLQARATAAMTPAWAAAVPASMPIHAAPPAATRPGVAMMAYPPPDTLDVQPPLRRSGTFQLGPPGWPPDHGPPATGTLAAASSLCHELHLATATTVQHAGQDPQLSRHWPHANMAHPAGYGMAHASGPAAAWQERVPAPADSAPHSYAARHAHVGEGYAGSCGGDGGYMGVDGRWVVAARSGETPPAASVSAFSPWVDLTLAQVREHRQFAGNGRY
eukprot:jgi/Ulvmu1/10957/UM007_0136.1